MKMPVYDRYGILPINTVLEAIRAGMGRSETRTSADRVLLGGQLVGVTSVRVRTFAVHGTMCCVCGLQGSFFAIERGPGIAKKGPYHLNLWAINQDGKEILMTSDHKLARSLGGSHSLANTQCMCGPCNWRKGSVEGKEAQRRKKEKQNGVHQELAGQAASS